jgi:hypothetical protein
MEIYWFTLHNRTTASSFSASLAELNYQLTGSKSHCDWQSVTQSVSLGVEPHLGLMTRHLLLFDSYGLVFLWGALSDERTGMSFVYSAGPCQRSLFRVQVPWESRPYFTVSDLKTSLFVASYDPQGHGGGIRPRHHTGSWLGRPNCLPYNPFAPTE